MHKANARRFSICILDDKIPLSMTSDLIDHREMSNLVATAKWKDTALKDLIKKLDSKKDKYILSGFTHCDSFINYIEEVIFSPEIIIFDWNYPGGSDPEKALLKILKCQYSKVFIFTENDNKSAIDRVIAKNEYKKYKINVITKGDSRGVEKLQKKINSALRTFSFSLGLELKQKMIKALDSILNVFGDLSFKEFVILFGEKVKGKNTTKLSAFEFAEIISDKLKTKLINTVLVKKNYWRKNRDSKVDQNHIREIWSFRLYHQPGDSIVRRGDIFEYSGVKLMVISSDCHLSSFWSKNMGYLMVTPIYRIDNPKLNKDLKLFNEKNLKQYSLSSLTNPKFIECITILPGLEVEEIGGIKTYFDYVLNAKGTYSLEIKKPKSINAAVPLKYEYISKAKKSFKNRKRIAEPFLTPLIEWIIRSITGLGVPDYSECLRKDIENKVKQI